MKIGLLLTEFPNQTSISMWRVGNALRELGNEVQIISSRHSSHNEKCHQSLYDEAKLALYAWPPQPLSAIRNIISHPISVIKCLHYIFKLEEGGFKVKLKLLPLMIAGAALARQLNKMKIEHVIVHSCANAAHLINLTYLCGGPSFSLRLGGDLEVYGDNQLAKFSNAAFSIPASLNNKQQILDWKLAGEEQILTTWLGVDVDKFIPQARPANSIIKLLTIARLNISKGHIYALEAMKEAIQQGVQLHYTIAGSGPHEEEIRRKIDQLQLQDHVALVGHVGEERAIELLQQADIFLLTSVGLGEASPVSLIEAMSCGVACVSSIIGGTAQIITHEVDGLLVEQKNIKDLTDAIITLASNDQLRIEMGKQARLSAEKYFSCTSVAHAIEEAISMVAADRNAKVSQLSPIEKKLQLHVQG